MPVDTSDFLLKEYETASALTNHVDDVRNSLTNFFLLLAGLAFGAFGFLLKDQPTHPLVTHPRVYAGILLLVVAAVGALFVGVLARLRRVQLERYQILGNLRRRLADPADVALIGLSAATMPKEMGRGSAHLAKRATGTYFWLLTILLTDSTLCALGMTLLLPTNMPGGGWWLAIVSAAAFMCLQDTAYFRLARYAPPSQSSATPPAP